jgi:hypothetical protein
MESTFAVMVSQDALEVAFQPQPELAVTIEGARPRPHC